VSTNDSDARETWATRLGFVLASVGSAVGLGNVWRFPFQTAENGGAAFLVVYVAAVAVIGLPALLAEYAIGRRANVNAVEAFRRLGHGRWWFVGGIGVVGGAWVLSYYSVIGGWVIRYGIGSLTGSYLADPASYFGAVSAGVPAVGFHAAFMALTIGVVALGIEDGIELATKLMVPAVVVLMIGLATFAATLPGAAAGYDYFLSPDLSTIVANVGTILPAAVGQALFSLSLGFSVMITYASYLDRDDSLLVDGAAVATFNSLIGVLAGFVVFPLLFAQGVAPDTAGPGAVFVSVPTALAELPGQFLGLATGQLLGVVFFGVVLLAALSSSISLLEVVTSFVVDRTSVPGDRPVVAAGLGTVAFLPGVLSALDTAWLSWFDAVSVNLLLPVAVLLVVVFTGWVLGDEAVAEVRAGAGGLAGLAPVWLWTLRTVVLLAVVGTVLLSVENFVGGDVAPPALFETLEAVVG
jgi:NSS family neurotransmitter:Na+ symporter